MGENYSQLCLLSAPQLHIRLRVRPAAVAFKDCTSAGNDPITQAISLSQISSLTFDLSATYRTTDFASNHVLRL